MPTSLSSRLLSLSLPLLLTVSISLVSVESGCKSTMSSSSEVAMINNEKITKAEFDENYQRTLKMLNLGPEAMKNDKSNGLSEMFKRMTMENMVMNTLVKQEAQRRKITVSQEELSDIYDKQVSRMGGEKAMGEQLKHMGISQADFQDQLRDQVIKDKMIKAVSGNAVSVTEAEARRFYDTHPKEFDQPEQVRARHILVGADAQQVRQQFKSLQKNISEKELDAKVKTSLAEKKKKADALLAQVLANPGQFETIAKNSSDDKGSAKEGGDLGYFAREIMVPAFSQAAFTTKPGKIKPALVETPFGFHIIQVIDRKAAEKRSFEEIKGQLITLLENQKKSQAMKTWLDNQKKSAKIKISPEYDYTKTASPLLKPNSGASAPAATVKPEAP